MAETEYRFEVALSLAGENAELVRDVATILRDRLGDEKVFFYEWFESEISGTDADLVLQKIYGNDARLVVPCVSQPYNEKPWTRLEWRAIRHLNQQLTDDTSRLRLLPLRFGDGEIDGTFAMDLIPDVRDRPAEAIAELVLDRVNLHRKGVPQSTPAESDSPEPDFATLARHQLPPPDPDFTGREDLIEQFTGENATKAGAVISGFTGTGGIGKTALAIVIANAWKDRFPDGQLFLEMRGIPGSGQDKQNPVTPPEAMAQVIRAWHPEAHLPEEETEMAPLFRGVLEGKRVLFLFDNARDAAQLRPLLPLPEGCIALVTSRQIFSLPGMGSPVRLNRLGRTESHELLQKKCPALRDDDALADGIVETCDYFPLALSLAGGAIAGAVSLTPGDYLEKLKANRLAALEQFADDTGLASVTAALQTSYDLLPDDTARKSWCELAVIPGSFDQNTVCAVWKWESEATVDSLEKFVRAGMLEFNSKKQRYRLHNLSRDFAAARLAEDERGAMAARIRIIKYFLAGSKKTLTKITAAFEDQEKILNTPTIVLTLKALINPTILPKLTTKNNEIKQQVWEFIESWEVLPELFRDIGDPNEEGDFLNTLARSWAMLGEKTKALEFHEQALLVFRTAKNQSGEGNALWHLALTFECVDDYAEAIDRANKAVAIFDTMKNSEADEVRKKIAEWDRKIRKKRWKLW